MSSTIYSIKLTIGVIISEDSLGAREISFYLPTDNEGISEWVRQRWAEHYESERAKLAAGPPQGQLFF